MKQRIPNLDDFINESTYTRDSWQIYHVIDLQRKKIEYEQQRHHIEYGSSEWDRLQKMNKDITDAKNKLNDADKSLLSTLWYAIYTEEYDDNASSAEIKKANKEKDKLIKKYPNLK